MITRKEIEDWFEKNKLKRVRIIDSKNEENQIEVDIDGFAIFVGVRDYFNIDPFSTNYFKELYERELKKEQFEKYTNVATFYI